MGKELEAEVNGQVMNLSFSCARLNINGDGETYRWEYDMAFGIFVNDLRLIGLPLHLFE